MRPLRRPVQCHRNTLIEEAFKFRSGGSELEKSVGVTRQYTGTAGRIENAPVGVFVAYASGKGAAFVDRALYLPREEWADDHLRREEAGVPDEVRFATKGELAKEMLQRAFEAKVPARWVVADTVYGTARGLRGWLEEQGRSYVLAVPSTKGISTTKGASGRRDRWPRTYPKKCGLGHRPARGARERGFMSGPSCRSRARSTGRWALVARAP